MAKDVPLNPQVPLAAAGSGAGYGIGKTLSVLLFYYVLSAETPENVRMAWELIIEATFGAGGAYFVAWLKGPPKA